MDFVFINGVSLNSHLKYFYFYFNKDASKVQKSNR